MHLRDGGNGEKEKGFGGGSGVEGVVVGAEDGFEEEWVCATPLVGEDSHRGSKTQEAEDTRQTVDTYLAPTVTFGAA